MKPALFLSGLVLMACGSLAEPSPGPAGTDTLRVSANGISLELLNFSDRPAFFFIYDREGAALKL